MRNDNSHLSDEQLLLELDGELTGRAADKVREHLSACWSCRARRQELEKAIANFVRVYRQGPEVDVSSTALLRARLAAASAEHGHRRAWGELFGGPALRYALTVCLVLGLFLAGGRHSLWHQQTPVVVMPNSRLTPGLASVTDQQAVCALANTKNKEVPAEMQRQVFKEYGMEKAEPRYYEVDYLVTPALGGSDDIRNLWPHSNSTTTWNARVKDELEDRLRDMVCDGSLDLTEAQHEIATNWITAYKKYFRTERPRPQ
jgi:hypothetical protein